MKKKKTIIIVVGVFLAIALIVGLVLGLDQVKNLFGQAASKQQPQGVRVTNIKANSATIVWQTASPAIGQIEYGTTPGSFLLRTAETNQTTNHSLTLSPLLPETIYYFRVRIGDQVYDNNGAPYSFTTQAAAETTLPTTPAEQPPTPASQVTSSPTPTQATPKTSPTPNPAIPTDGAPKSSSYTMADFVEKFGTSDPEFDINKDGVVNSQDWSLYQQQNP